MRGVIVPPRLRVIVLACALALLAGLPALATAAERPAFRGTRARPHAGRARGHDAQRVAPRLPGQPRPAAARRPLVRRFLGRSRAAGPSWSTPRWRATWSPAFRALYRAGFPIRRMQPIERYGGDDFASIEADNTSSFNCRAATGSSNWSNHAYGLRDRHQPDREPLRLGRAHLASGERHLPQPLPGEARAWPSRARALVRAFDAVGWGWGGRWSGGTQDLQHFSPNGR